MASTTIRIGDWIEPTEREITRCPSYYAADYETLRVRPQRVPLLLQFGCGYTVPMPKWLLASVKSERLSGKLYSGCGGVNYSSRDLPAGEAVDYVHQLYSYELPRLIETGRVELLDGIDASVVDFQRNGITRWEQLQGDKVGLTREQVFEMAKAEYYDSAEVVWDSPNQDEFPNRDRNGIYHFGIRWKDSPGLTNVTTWGPKLFKARKGWDAPWVGRILSSYCLYAD